LTKIITTAIAVVVLAAPTSAFYEACFYSDNECTTKVDCLTADEFAEAVTDDASDDDYGPNNMTSCDDYFDMYNEQDHDHDFTMNVTVFESCRKNVSPCSLQCKGTALSTACIADCDTKCAECSTSRPVTSAPNALNCTELHGIARKCTELHGIARNCTEWHGIARNCTELYGMVQYKKSQEETCKSYHCPSTIPGTTTKYLSSQSDCLKTTTMKTTTALAPTAGGSGDGGTIAVAGVKVVSMVLRITLPAKLNIKALSKADYDNLVATHQASAAAAAGIDEDEIQSVAFYIDGKKIETPTQRRDRRAEGEVTMKIIFKEGYTEADARKAAASFNAAVEGGTAGKVTVTLADGTSYDVTFESAEVVVETTGVPQIPASASSITAGVATVFAVAAAAASLF